MYVTHKEGVSAFDQHSSVDAFRRRREKKFLKIAIHSQETLERLFRDVEPRPVGTIWSIRGHEKWPPRLADWCRQVALSEVIGATPG